MGKLEEKLTALQYELKAPKGQYNSFGKYKYRSCEDILEAVKPLCMKYGLCLTVSDEMRAVGERYYICSSATVTDTETGAKTSCFGFAREEETKKGMDASQITGSASSYARKYALNGLLCIDDTKDSDATNKGEEKPKEYKCADCGKPFETFVDSTGEKWTPGQLYHASQSKNADGVARCAACRKKHESQEENK